MHPLLFKIGDIPIHTYGVLIAIGFLCALKLIQSLASRAGLDVEKVLDLTFWCFLVGFVGARTLFIITRFDQFVADPSSIFKIWEGGLVFFGGPLAAVPFGIAYLKRHKLPIWATMDCMLPGLVIAHIFGRFGCVASGCCYGKPTGTGFGLVFDSPQVDAALRGIPLHPTQLYEASALAILLVGMLWVFRNRKFDGQVALVYFMAYPIIRSVVEVYRGDIIRGFVIQDLISTSQFISFLVFIAASIALYFRLRQLEEGGRPA